MLTRNLNASIGLLMIRLALGAIFLMHGWQKYNEWTIAGVTQNFSGMGIPMADIAAPAITYLELVGGALLILGVATRLLGVLFTLDMAGAIYFVHGGAGFFADGGGYEFVLLLGATSLALAFLGSGVYSVDSLFSRRSRR